MIAKTARSPRILIVEDVQETRDAIKQLLKRDGYNVDPARDEEEAVVGLRRFRNWKTTVALGIAAGVLLESLELLVSLPLLRPSADSPPRWEAPTLPCGLRFVTHRRASDNDSDSAFDGGAAGGVQRSIFLNRNVCDGRLLVVRFRAPVADVSMVLGLWACFWSTPSYYSQITCLHDPSEGRRSGREVSVRPPYEIVQERP